MARGVPGVDVALPLQNKQRSVIVPVWQTERGVPHFRVNLSLKINKKAIICSGGDCQCQMDICWSGAMIFRVLFNP